MSQTTFDITIATYDEVVYKGKISSLVAPGKLGYLGILAHHAPLMTGLVPGRISMQDDAGKATILRSEGKGLLEVLNNSVTMLMESVTAV